MIKKIKYEKLSRDIRQEIDNYHAGNRQLNVDVPIEDSMVKWFNDCFEDWIRRKYTARVKTEKRRNFRIDIEIPVTIVDTIIETSREISKEIGLAGTIKNISRGGLYCRSDRHIEPSSVVMTRIDLSAVDAELGGIEALAMVMRSKKIKEREYGIGLMFSSIYDDKKENLDLFVFMNFAYHIHSI